MRKLRLLLAAAVVAVPLATVAASPASACPQGACPGRCKVNPPVTVGDGVIYFNDGRLVECYY